MREQKLIVEPFELLDILSCQGKIEADSHGYMEVQGHIHADKELEYQQLLLTELWVNIKVYDENGTAELLFTGIVTAGDIIVENGVKTLHIVIRTGSFLMDLQEHIRTFQNSADTYHDLLKTMMSDYGRASNFIMNKGKEESIDRFLCQYHETDWQFAKRLASYCHTWLYPNEVGEGIKFYFGLPSGEDKGAINPTEYSLHQKDGSVTYVVRLRDLFHIGDKILFQNQILRILSRETSWVHGELYHVYELRTQEKKQETPIFNNDLIGASLMGVVTGVKGTEVTLSVTQDENKTASGSKWFSYATVYSSPDGTGWYFMPEIGDSVRLYFPSQKEQQAYVFNAIHLASRTPGKRTNPDYKSIMNKQGKEILLKPDSILVTNNAGMSLELSDRKGISIISDKKIILSSQDSVEITSEDGQVDITA
ncbi:MAG: phage late control D family protein, partial [Butyrivibrio sp.]|nr:phage late control D family protein [Butyrivibrio sp.]